MEDLNDKIEKKVSKDSRLILSAFMAGTGILMWVLVYVFNPMSTVQKDIALIQQSIDNINKNHEAHIQDIMKNIEELKQQDKAMDDKLDIQQQAIIKLLK